MTKNYVYFKFYCQTFLFYDANSGLDPKVKKLIRPNDFYI